MQEKIASLAIALNSVKASLSFLLLHATFVFLIIFFSQFVVDVFKVGVTLPRFADQQFARFKAFFSGEKIFPMALDFVQKSTKACKAEALRKSCIERIEMTNLQMSYVEAIEKFVKSKIEASANQPNVKKIIMGRILPKIKTWISKDVEQGIKRFQKKLCTPTRDRTTKKASDPSAPAPKRLKSESEDQGLSPSPGKIPDTDFGEVGEPNAPTIP